MFKNSGKIFSSTYLREITSDRVAYIFWTFFIWLIFPLLAGFVVIRFILNTEAWDNVTGYSVEIFSFWYIQIPLFLYITRNRVLDAGLNPFLTFVFVLPPLNIVLWFWPSKKKYNVSDQKT